jgi:hypothetical protein
MPQQLELLPRHCEQSASLTDPDPDLARRIKATPRGMAHWSGAIPNAVCGMCRHYGCVSAIYNKGETIGTKRHPTSCALYFRQMRQPGGPLPYSTPACKYYEAR